LKLKDTKALKFIKTIILTSETNIGNDYHTKTIATAGAIDTKKIQKALYV
jgi:hypothetical protein